MSEFQSCSTVPSKLRLLVVIVVDVVFIVFVIVLIVVVVVMIVTMWKYHSLIIGFCFVGFHLSQNILFSLYWLFNSSDNWLKRKLL